MRGDPPASVGDPLTGSICRKTRARILQRPCHSVQRVAGRDRLVACATRSNCSDRLLLLRIGFRQLRFRLIGDRLMKGFVLFVEFKLFSNTFFQGQIVFLMRH